MTDRCTGNCQQGRACTCSPTAALQRQIQQLPPSKARPRLGHTGARHGFVLRHPTLVTYVLLALILSAWLLASVWDQQALLALGAP